MKTTKWKTVVKVLVGTLMTATLILGATSASAGSQELEQALQQYQQALNHYNNAALRLGVARAGLNNNAKGWGAALAVVNTATAEAEVQQAASEVAVAKARLEYLQTH